MSYVFFGAKRQSGPAKGCTEAIGKIPCATVAKEEAEMVGAVRRVVTGETRDGTRWNHTQVEEVEPRRPGGEILPRIPRGDVTRRRL